MYMLISFPGRCMIPYIIWWTRDSITFWCNMTMDCMYSVYLFMKTLCLHVLASHLSLLQRAFLGAECRFEKREPSDGKHATDVKDVTTWKNRLRLGNSVKKKITQTKQATTKSYQRGHKKRPSIAQSWQSWAHRKHLRQHSKLPSGSWWCTGYRSRGHRLDGEPSTPRKLGHRPCSRQRRSPFRGTWQRSKSAPSSRRRTCTQMKRNKEMEREKNEYNSETCCEGE